MIGLFKLWKRLKDNKGFSPVELLLAATVFGFLTTALIGAIIYGRTSLAEAGDRARAVALAEEGLEATRNIRDATYSNLTNGTYGAVQSGNVWTLSGSSDTTDIFTRQITIADASSNSKTITATVNWNNGSVSRQTTATSRLTNWAAALASTSGPIMMVYSKTTTTPFYRIWDGASWGAEGSAQTVGGNINYMVLKSSDARNESILGTLDSNGNIYVQIWDGSTWSTPRLMANVGTTLAAYRGFDIEYEENGDRAVVMYLPSSTGVDPAYQIWNGTSWDTTGTTVTTPPTTGIIRWIDMAANPLSSSNAIAMIMIDANIDVYGMAWNGSAWGDMGNAAVWDATAATANKQTIAVEYEQQSGEALFIWGDTTATDQYYRTWNGTTLGVVTLLDIANEGGIAEWLVLAARPSSNEIILGVQDAGADLNTRKWSGSTWDAASAHPEHDATVENITSRNFDIAWETHSANPNSAWLMWGDQATVSVKNWSAVGWGTATTLAGSDDTSFVKVKADPISGAVFAGIYEDSSSATDDIWETRLTGGSGTWAAENTIWGGPTGATPVFYRIDIATHD